ncbi:AMP-dependent synthetase/ligase [Roseateles sp. PN1]|uniref:AMP-dependent synthetase/ligase n=1 Tax=Roseateles sp. PN1 TaxID=3137372 RepID=UPI003138EF6E
MTDTHAPGGAAAERQLTPFCLLATAARIPDRPAYYVRGERSWEPHSWAELLAVVQRAARALVALGVQPHQSVCILGFNRPEWLIMDHAAMMVGATTAGIYWTSAPTEVDYILNHAKAPLLLLEDAAQLAKIEGRRKALPYLKDVVSMGGVQLPQTLAWDAFLALGSGADAADLQAEVEGRLAALQPSDLGALIYTSGTTGHPKAVMLSHGNLAWTAQALNQIYRTHERSRLISFLPFAHVAEKVGAIHAPARGGYAIYFARAIDQLLDHMKEVHPTIYFGVPRLWEKMHTGLAEKIGAATGIKGVLARWSMGVSRRWHECRLYGRSPGLLQRLQMGLARRLVLNKVKKALGLDEAVLLISGAAPISPENLNFFLGLDLVVREVYGQSEVCGPATLNVEGATRIGSVGRAIPGLALRIAEDGEVLMQGPGVFVGYAGDARATAEALQGGWLHSGDLGRLDEQGYLYITGRKKDLIITSGGKNISPANVESDLMSQPLIEHAVVVGEGRHFLAALLTLKAAELQAFAEREGLPQMGLLQHPKLLAAVQAQVDEVNARHARVSQVRKFDIIAGNFSIDAGQLTPTLKLRRTAVIEAHRDVVEALYRD